MPYFHAAIKAPASASVAVVPAKVGVLIVNLGTPDTPTYFAVQRYLRAFLGDRRVIDTSRLIWLPLLYGLVLPLRPLKTASKYRSIWMADGSPLAVYTKRLVDKIAAALARSGAQVQVELAMCYGNPSIDRAMKSLAENEVTRLLVLPLYPHYCSSTTASVFDGAMQALRRWRRLPDLRFINDYYDDPGYIDTLTEHIQRHWESSGRTLAFGVFVSRYTRILCGERRSLSNAGRSDHSPGGGAAPSRRGRLVALLSVAFRTSGVAAAIHDRHLEKAGG